jgi:hypothetical protein
MHQGGRGETPRHGAGQFQDRDIGETTKPELVRMKRLELSLRLKNSDLNAARLPIPPHPHRSGFGGGYVAKRKE